MSLLFNCFTVFGGSISTILGYRFANSWSAFFTSLTTDPWLIYMAILFAILLLARFFFDVWTKKLWGYRLDELHDKSPGFQYDVAMRKANLALGKKVLTFTVIAIPVLYLGYIAVSGTPMQGHVMEWLNLIVRWFHIVVGIMWIGASFYFIFLENNLNRKGVRGELAGNLWAIHGGGFYYLEKYKVAPEKIPEDLHWFKYEAYLTWISGFALLFLVYYMNPGGFFLNPAGPDISVAAAILIGIGSLVVGWLIYDLMCKSPLINKPWLFIGIGLILLTGLSWFLVQVFSSRAAFIHVGGVMGTIMVANVFFVIIPSQKSVVRAALSGEKPDASLGDKAMQRSLHNNYFTLPVIFTMISHHFPGTIGHDYNWLILMGIIIASAGIKHYWNLIERGFEARYILPVSVIGLFALALITSPLADRSGEVDLSEPVSFSEVDLIIQTHCVQCHSENPSDEIWTTAPGDIKLDTPQQVQDQADAIMRTTVRSEFMPLANQTNMSQQERDQLHRWIEQGAKVGE